MMIRKKLIAAMMLMLSFCGISAAPLYFIAWFIHRHVKIYRVVYLLLKLFFRFFRFCIFSLSHVTSPHFRRIGSKESMSVGLRLK